MQKTPRELTEEEYFINRVNAEGMKANELFLQDLQKVLNTTEGVRVFKKILSILGFNQPSYSQNSLCLAYTAGQKDLALKLFLWISKASPKQISSIVEGM